MKKILSILTSVMMAGFLSAQSPCDSLPKISIQSTSTTPCDGDSITLSASGGAVYQWNNNVQNGVSFIPSGSDTFRVTVTDTLGCVGQGKVFVELLSLPNIVANSSSLTTCIGDSIQLTATNGINYVWLNPPAFPNGNYYKPSQVGANIFEVRGEGANGCSNTSQVIVLVKPTPASPSTNLASINTCINVPFTDEFVAITDTGRAFWYFDAQLQNLASDQANFTPSNNQVGIKEYFAIANLGGCISSTASVSAEVYALPEVNAGADIEVKAGDEVNLSGTVNSSNTEVEWSPIDIPNDPYSLSTFFIATESATLTLTAIDENECVNSDSVKVLTTRELVISNLITPNGDGNNDTWKMYPLDEAQGCELVIFDGFGRLLFETSNYQNDWDGKYEGEELPDGDYYFQLTCNEQATKGTITLVR